MRMRSTAVAVPVALLALTIGAAAQEFCVTCSGPEASYRCLIGGDGTAAGRSSRGQFLCITELAKAGGHASCSATRGQDTPCPGETRTVMFSLGDPGASPLEGAPAPTAAPAAKPLFVPVPSANDLPPVALPPPAQQAHEPLPPPPQETGAAPAPAEKNAIENLADKTGKAVSDTGKAVGSAVKKSWDCVASLFGDC